MNNIKKIGLFGFGTVGKGVYDLLSQHWSLPVEIKKVCVQRVDIERINHSLYFTNDPNELLYDDDIDIVIEAISDAEVAKTITDTALSLGKPVVSASKKMLGSSIRDIDNWHKTYEAPLLYEASVGGGIPILRSIDQVFQYQGIEKIRGILNGSSNYILTQMTQNNVDFETALEEAQIKGFAEANPTLDIDGFDASYKLSILGYHAFGEVIDLKKCTQESIRNVSLEELKKLKGNGKKIKPIASLEKVDGGYQCSIKPEIIGPEDDLFNIDFENNAIAVHTTISGVHTLVGKGAGAFPTGSAILSDLQSILKGEKYKVARLSEVIAA